MNFRFVSAKRSFPFLIPLAIGAILAFGILAAQTFQTWHSAQGFRTSVSYFRSTSELIHELQRERGKSSVYLSGGISREELEGQRRLVNKKVDSLVLLLPEVHRDVSESTTKILSEHVDVRTYVTARGKVSESILQYSKLIDRLIALQVRCSQAHSWNGREAQLVSQSVFESVKENMGKIRAIASSALAGHQSISRADQHQLELFRSGVIVTLNSPGLLVSTEVRKRIDHILSSSSWRATERVLDQIQVGAVVETGDNEFFTTITATIDAIFSEITAETARIDTEAKSSYLYFSTIFWIAILVIGAVLILLFALIISSLRHATATRAHLFQTSKLSTLGEMAAGMAHELNQPLAGISLGVQTIQKLKARNLLTDEELAGSIKSIQASIERCTRLVDHVRRFARQDKTLHFSPLSINDTIDSALMLIGQQLKGRGIEVAKDLSATLPLVNGEPYQLEQVWLNILSNAGDALDLMEETGKQDNVLFNKKLSVSAKRDGEDVHCLPNCKIAPRNNRNQK